MRLPALLAVAAVSALDFQEEQLEWVKPEVTGAVPEPREGHCAHLVQQSLYIYGGSTHTPMDLHDLHVLDLGAPCHASSLAPQPSRSVHIRAAAAARPPCIGPPHARARTAHCTPRHHHFGRQHELGGRRHVRRR